jgi:lysophospholipase L1-like esterase
MKLRQTVLLALLLPAIQARALEINDVKLDGFKITLENQTFTIDPPSLKSDSHDFELKAGKPDWRGPTILPSPAKTFAAIHLDTLDITLANDRKTHLQYGRDFLIDPIWSAVAGVKDSKYPPGTKVHAEYKYGLARLDLIERTAAGKLNLIKGTEDIAQPMLPEPTAGSTPVLSIYLPTRTTALQSQNINIIDPTYDGIPPVKRKEALTPLKEKITSGKPTTIIFLGDSITTQPAEDFRDKKGNFVERFADWLGKAYPENTVVLGNVLNTHLPRPMKKQIVVIKAGVPGNTSADALKRTDKDVIANKPDAVFIMLGVNDEEKGPAGNIVPVPQYKENVTAIVDKIKAAGAIPILMTPSMKNLAWPGTSGTMGEYAQAVREIADAKNLCLIDHYRAWELLPKRGYNYMIFLGTAVNHPIDLGHDLFLRGLKAAFQEAEKKPVTSDPSPAPPKDAPPKSPPRKAPPAG